MNTYRCFVHAMTFMWGEQCSWGGRVTPLVNAREIAAVNHALTKVMKNVFTNHRGQSNCFIIFEFSVEGDFWMSKLTLLPWFFLVSVPFPSHLQGRLQLYMASTHWEHCCKKFVKGEKYLHYILCFMFYGKLHF